MAATPPGYASPTNGARNFGVRTLSDLVAFAGLLAMLLSVVAWGLKLEGEMNGIRDHVVENSAAIKAGILPRADEKLSSHAMQIGQLDRRLGIVEIECKRD